MSAAGSIQYTIVIGGVRISRTVTRMADHPNPYEVTLPKGKAGTLSTRTDNGEGVITSSSHGFDDSVKVDVYWSGGRRYGMTVSSYDGNTLTITGGSGDNFPAEDSVVVVNQQVEITTLIDGDAMQLAAVCAEFPTASSDDPAHVDFQDSGTATIDEIDLVANEPWTWDAGNGQANPWTGNPIIVCYASNGGRTEDATLKIVTLEDATP